MQNPLCNDRWAKVIPRQVILRAQNGSIEDIWAIQCSLTLENCSVDVLNVALKELTVYDSPLSLEKELETGDVGRRSKRSLACTAILCMAVVSAGARPDIKKVLLSTFQNPVCIDALCRWITLCLFVPARSHHRDATSRYVVSFETMSQACRVVSALLSMNNGFIQPFLASTAFVDLVVHVWMDKLERGDDFFVDDGSLGMPICTSLWMLRACVEDPNATEALLNRISEKKRFRELPSTFIRRAQQIQAIASRKAPTEFTTETLYVMFEVLDRLLETDPYLRQQFIRNDYMSQFSSTLHSISLSISSSSSTVTLFQFLKPLSRLSVHASEQSTRGAAYWSDLISGEFIPTIRRVLESIPESDTTLVTFACQIVTTLSLFATYPTVIKAILKLPGPDASTGLVHSSYLAFDTWDSLWERAGNASKLYQKVGSRVRLCDNIACNRPAEKDFNPKQCSICSSVVYCSTDCQKRDWEQFHKEECGFAREDHYSRKSTASVYSHATRMFHTKWIESEYNDHLNGSVLRSLTKDLCADHALHETLPMFLYISNHQDMDVASLRETRWWTSKAHWDFTQDYLEPRVASLIDQYKSGSLSEDTRLVEGVFHFAKKKMVYLTVMLKRKGGKYEGVWSLAKHANCIDDP